MGLTNLVDYAKLIRDHRLLDIITVDGLHYAISSGHDQVALAGLTIITAHQLPQYLQLFLRQGYSQRYRMQYAKLVGMRSWVLFRYSLTGLAPLRKQALSHALSGVQGRPGALAKLGGEKVGRTACLVPLEVETEAAAFFASKGVAYTTEVVLRGE